MASTHIIHGVTWKMKMVYTIGETFPLHLPCTHSEVFSCLMTTLLECAEFSQIFILEFGGRDVPILLYEMLKYTMTFSSGKFNWAGMSVTVMASLATATSSRQLALHVTDYWSTVAPWPSKVEWFSGEENWPDIPAFLATHRGNMIEAFRVLWHSSL